MRYIRLCSSLLCGRQINGEQSRMKETLWLTDTSTTSLKIRELLMKRSPPHLIARSLTNLVGDSVQYNYVKCESDTAEYGQDPSSYILPSDAVQSRPHSFIKCVKINC